VSFLSLANPEKGDPNPGMFILLSYFVWGFRPTASNQTARRKWATLLHLWELRVGQRLQEGDDVLDLGIREPQLRGIFNAVDADRILDTARRTYGVIKINSRDE
jgi:hypothetical protein